jgi:hypothetical protein
MTSHGLSVGPPRIVTWLVQLFASPQEVEGVLGDLMEEFSASVLDYGHKEACRRYRRQAWRTIRDLALSPLRERPSSSTTITASGVALTAGIGLAGLIMIWPISWGLNEMARVIVTRYPVTFYIPAPALRGKIDLLGLLISGAMVTAVARVVRVRAMSAALAMVAVMAIEIAIDRPLMMWLYGPPFAAPFAFGSWFVRWARGVLVFGSTVLIGAAIGRIMARRDDALQSPRSA